MPPNIEVALLVIGVILFAIGVLGGGAGFGITIAQVEKIARVVLGCVGVFFIVISLVKLGVFPPSKRRLTTVTSTMLLVVGLAAAVYYTPPLATPTPTPLVDTPTPIYTSSAVNTQTSPATHIPQPTAINIPAPTSTPTPKPTNTPVPQARACTPMALNKAEVVPAGMWVLIRVCTPGPGNDSACIYTVEQSKGGTYTPNEHSGNSPRTGIWAYCAEDEAKKAANSEASDPSFIQWWPATQIPFPELIPTPNDCPFRELADEINVGNNTGACATIPLAEFLDIMNGTDVYSAIERLDKIFEADIRTGYQYRDLIPARIPPAPPRQRVMWSSLTWIDELPSGEKERVNSRIYRIRCNSTNPCIYVILDGDEFSVNYRGRGILLSEPLADELLQTLSQ